MESPAMTTRQRAWITSADPGKQLGISHEMQRGKS